MAERRSRSGARGARRTMVALLGIACAAAGTAAEDAALLRHRASIVVEQNAPFVRLPLPVAVYARSASPGLADLRVVDSRGERVPFALLAPRPDEVRTQQLWRDAALYRLPPRPAAGTAWTAPVDVTLDGGRITVRQRAGAPTPPERSPGWLIDLGERAKDEPAPTTLRLAWSEPAEFSAAYTIELSADLRRWRAGAPGQLMALAARTGTLTQPDIVLPDHAERFIRLVWTGRDVAPPVTGARAARPATSRVALDAPTEVLVATSSEPPSAHAGDDAARALHFDLGAVLPLASLELRLQAGTRVFAVRVQARSRIDEPWHVLASTVIYRIERDDAAEPVRSPALAVGRSVRFVRIVADARSAAPPAADVRLAAQADLASVVFAAQGTPPYSLLAGSAKADVGALPLATLLPQAADERARLGRASLGGWAEVAEAADQAAAAERRAALRPWLLWGTLVAGVVLLAVMAWRLGRGAKLDAATGDTRTPG